MINRELIRIKVVQLVYAFYQNGNRAIADVEKELLLSLDKAYELYHYLLLLIVAVTQEERHRLEIGIQRAEREGTALPSDRFAYNRFAVQLEENTQLGDYVEKQLLSWTDYTEFIRNLCDRIEQTADYRAYMDAPETDYAADRELWRRLYKQVVQDNEALDSLLEEQSIYWNDDKLVIDTFVLKTIKRFEPDNGAQQELLPEFKDDYDREFAIELIHQALTNAQDYQQYMNVASKNWDLSRLAYMDIVIMQIAIAEMLTFANIPVSVTINEYVELAKSYSTPKSGSYINGMLDTIAHHLSKEGKLLKPVPFKHPSRNTEQRKDNV